MEFFNLKQPPGANKYHEYTAVYSKYTAVYSRVYGRILRYWSLEYTAVYPKSPKWGIFKHNIDHHNWQTRGIPQPTYACIVHYTFVPTCTCHIPLSPKTPFFTRILPGIPGMPGYAHHIVTTLLVTTQCKPPPPPMSQHQHGSSISTDQVRILGGGCANFTTSMHRFPTSTVLLITCLVHPWLLRVPHEMNTCTAHSEKTCVWEIHRNRAITVWHRDIPRGRRYILGSHRSIT